MNSPIRQVGDYFAGVIKEIYWIDEKGFMKKILLFLLLLFTFLSCGKKANSTNTKFKVFSSNLTEAEAQIAFPGGLIIAGRSFDGAQSFTLAYQPGLELNLQKGGWEFATIGWMGTSPMEGNQKCATQVINIDSDNFTVNFDMNKVACFNSVGKNGNRFSDPIFYNFIGKNLNGFKKLQVKTCPSLSADCSASQVAPYSFKVEIPALLKGVSLNVLPLGLNSVCVSGGTGISNITPPHGGKDGFLGVRVTTFPFPQTSFNNPKGVVADSLGNIYVLNTSNHNIRKISSNGTVSTFAGSVSAAPVFGSTDAVGPDARFKSPAGIAMNNSTGDIYVADTYNNKIRKIDSSGSVTTLAGDTSNASGSAEGSGSAASFYLPNGIAVNSSTGDIFVADTSNNKIRKITSGGYVTTFAGSGSVGHDDYTGSSATFNLPRGIAIDPTNTYLIVADTGNHMIRKITISGASVSTVAGTAGTAGHTAGTGTAAKFDTPTGVAIDSSNNIYVTDSQNQTIRKIDSAAVVTTFAGVYAQNVPVVDGVRILSHFFQPQGIAINSSGDLFVADTNNFLIRKISGDTVSSFAGTAGVAGNNDSGSTAGCSGAPKSYMFPHGDGEQSAATAMSIDVNATSADIALAPFFGVITDNVYSHLPPIPGGSHALFFYDAPYMGSPLYAFPGNYIYFDGANWTKFNESDSVKLLLQQ